MLVTGPAYGCKAPFPVHAIVTVSVDVPVAGSPSGVDIFFSRNTAVFASVAVMTALSIADRVRCATINIILLLDAHLTRSAMLNAVMTALSIADRVRCASRRRIMLIVAGFAEKGRETPA